MKPKVKNPLPLLTFEHKRDAYGFAVRPQHLQRYREYASIYREEEEERSERWNSFLERIADSATQPDVNGLPEDEVIVKDTETAEEEDGVGDGKSVDGVEEGKEEEESGEKPVDGLERDVEGEDGSDKKSVEGSSGRSSSVDGIAEEEVTAVKESKSDFTQRWAQIRPSLSAIEHMMSIRVKKKGSSNVDQDSKHGKHLDTIEEPESEEGSDDEFYDVERSDPVQETLSADNGNYASDEQSTDTFFPWKEELEVLVRGGVPMALRGEVWQTFVGVRKRREEGYYQDLLASEANTDKQHDSSVTDDTSKKSSGGAPEKWKGQIEKDLPRTFPGHPALDEDGRNALRRLLTAYARHNPSVGYCQAMNFFAGLLLLLMPEENAFWALLGIMDDYFDGYYSEEMIESQVDQLVYEDLVRERFPKLVNHLDYLGVEVAWVTGPWFLSIFVNMLPWESVLRVWDVLLFEGNRVMLFRTALALMDLYGPALVTTKDAGDAVTLLQSLAGSTFDSSQLVLTACMGYQGVNEARLQDSRDKHRPSVIAALEERLKGLRATKDSRGLACKLYSFKHDPTTSEGSGDKQRNGGLGSGSADLDDFLVGLNGDSEADAAPDLQEQVVWLKVELCRLLEEKRSASLRAEELETALMEMVTQDNRRQLSARVEMLEQEVVELRQALTDKQEQERAMIQVLMRVEQEQKLTEDARRFAEQDAAAQRYATNVLQEKYEEAITSLGQMEKRVVMAESMLEATIQYQSGQVKSQASPRSVQSDSPSSRANQDSTQDFPPRKVSLLSRPFGLGWRDRNKQQDKPTTVEDQNRTKSNNEAQTPVA